MVDAIYSLNISKLCPVGKKNIGSPTFFKQGIIYLFSTFHIIWLLKDGCIAVLVDPV
jgi:hypothetical protein